MTREEYNRRKMQYELSHAGYGTSSLKGTQQDNVKYYKRIGKPGEYRYFYTKEAWDAYNKEASTKTNNANSKELVDSIKRQQDIAKNKAADEAMKKAEQEKWAKIKKENDRAAAASKMPDSFSDPDYGQKLADALRENLEYAEEHTKQIEAQKERNRKALALAYNVYKASKYGDNSDIDEAYQKMEENRKTLEKDPATGLPLKNYEIPLMEEIYMVNPGFGYTDNADHSMNCVLCTLAMALRMRGYDVSAGKDDDGVTWDYGWFNSIFNEYDDIFTETPDKGEWEKSYDKVINDIKSQPVGAYGDFQVVWNSKYGGAHSMFYAIEKDGLHIYDAQTGKEVKEDQYKQYVQETRYVRLDTATIDIDYVKKHNMIIY